MKTDAEIAAKEMVSEASRIPESLAKATSQRRRTAMRKRVASALVQANTLWAPGKKTRRFLSRVLHRVSREPGGMEKFQSRLTERHRVALGLVWERLLKIALEGKDTDAINAAKVLATRFDPEFGKEDERKGSKHISDLLQMLRDKGDKIASPTIRAVERTRSVELSASIEQAQALPTPILGRESASIPQESQHQEVDLAAEHAKAIVAAAIGASPPPGGTPGPQKDGTGINTNTHGPVPSYSQNFGKKISNDLDVQHGELLRSVDESVAKETTREIARREREERRRKEVEAKRKLFGEGW